MNAVVDAIAGVLGGETEAEKISRVGHQCFRDANAIENRLYQLSITFVTVAQLLGVEKPNAEINFAAYDATLAEADKLLKKCPDACFTMSGATDSLRENAEVLRARLEQAKPWRAHQP